MAEPRLTVWSIGHSTHEFDDFLALLQRQGIGVLADIRSVPKSRRHPHFHTDALADSLPAAGVRYVRVGELGGWRSPSPETPNGGWRNRSFRGYADHSLTAEFAAGIEVLLGHAASARTAMMCSEALWWRCHRRLVADRLVTMGHEVLHVGSDGRTAGHAVTPFARPGADGRLVYPSPEAAGA